jgi:hypothetical protein
MTGFKKNAALLIAALLLTLCLARARAADDVFYLDFYFDSRSSIDSTRKDYYEPEFSPTASSPQFVAQQYDRNFAISQTDMLLAIRGDLNEAQFFDVKEKLYWQHLNNEDYYARSFRSRKLKEIDHELNVTYGIAAGDHDYFQLDYFNNYYDVSLFEPWQSTANKGQGKFFHEFSERTALSIVGAYEERQYDQDLSQNFREGSVGFEVLTYIRGRSKYVPLANSARGKRSYFESFPNGLAARNAVDYYTDWTTNPDDNDPGARYKEVKTTGDLYLRLYADAATHERTELNNRSVNSGLGLELNYELAPDLALRLDDYYQRTDWRAETGVNFLFDNYSNRLSLSATFEYNDYLSQSVSFMNEMVKNINFSDEDYQLNQLSYEGFYARGKTRGSLLLAALRRRFDESRLLYPDEDEFKLAAGYDYLLIDQLRFILRGEFIDKDYIEFEDTLWSSYQRNSFRAAVEKIFSQRYSLEIAYQENTEKHKNFVHNNIEEKSLSLSWLTHF